MKVAIITFLFDPEQGGGAANSARRLAYGLRDKGNEVVVITTHGTPTLSSSLVDGIKVYYFLPRNLYWVAEKDQHPLYKKMLWQLIDTWNPYVYQQVKQILTQEKPDIVHVQKLRGLSPSVWKAAQESGCQKLVQTCRDYELMSPEGTLSGQLGKHASEGAWFLRPYQWFRSRLSEQVQVATAPSAYTLNSLTSRGFFAKAQRRVVPNTHGFTDSELEQLKSEKPTQQFPNLNPGQRFLYLGRLEDVKGVDLLCDAFSRTVHLFPNSHLDIVGFGTKENDLRHAFENNPQITVHGALFGEAKHAILAASDVMVVPSIWPEVFGNVVVEAFAYGKPVIAAASGGLPELVEHGKTGFLVKPGDKEGLERALNLFASNPQLSKKMSPNCFLAAERYSVESITNQYLAAYDWHLHDDHFQLHENHSIEG